MNPRRQHERYAARADIQERTRAPGAENTAALGPVLKYTRQKVDVGSVDEGTHHATQHSLRSFTNPYDDLRSF
jgi:hypothetical protein